METDQEEVKNVDKTPEFVSINKLYKITSVNIKKDDIYKTFCFN